MSPNLKVVRDKFGKTISNWYDENVLPKVIDLVCGSRLFKELRRELLEGLSGSVVEVGFGSGTNVEFIPSSVTSYLGIEPSVAAIELGKRRKLPPRVIPIVSVGEALAIRSNSIDFVLFSFVLCSVDDPFKVVKESLRILKPGGELRFIEHGKSSGKAMARVQKALDPLEMAVAGNCRLSRVPDEFFNPAEWTQKVATENYLGSRSPWSYVYRARYLRAPLNSN